MNEKIKIELIKKEDDLEVMFLYFNLDIRLQKLENMESKYIKLITNVKDDVNRALECMNIKKIRKIAIKDIEFLDN